MINIEIIKTAYKHFAEGEDEIEENIFSALPRYIHNYRIEGAAWRRQQSGYDRVLCWHKPSYGEYF